jgi:hypothetical protein
MFSDMFNALEKGAEPMETFYDGYVVNAIMDACYRSAQTKKWEPVQIEDWRGQTGLTDKADTVDYDKQHLLIKEEILPDGRKKVIIKSKTSVEISEKIV